MAVQKIKLLYAQVPQTQLDTSRRLRTIGRMIAGLAAEFLILKCLESLAPLVSFKVPLNRSYSVYL